MTTETPTREKPWAVISQLNRIARVAVNYGSSIELRYSSDARVVAPWSAAYLELFETPRQAIEYAAGSSRVEARRLEAIFKSNFPGTALD